MLNCLKCEPTSRANDLLRAMLNERENDLIAARSLQLPVPSPNYTFANKSSSSLVVFSQTRVIFVTHPNN